MDTFSLIVAIGIALLYVSYYACDYYDICCQVEGIIT